MHLSQFCQKARHAARVWQRRRAEAPQARGKCHALFAIFLQIFDKPTQLAPLSSAQLVWGVTAGPGRATAVLALYSPQLQQPRSVTAELRCTRCPRCVGGRNDIYGYK